MHRMIYWRQGMLLKPQHFQHSDLAAQSTEWKIWQRVGMHPWGVVESEIDAALLSGGVATLNNFEAIFPDGSWVRKGLNAYVMPVSFKIEHLFSKSNFMVYAGIHKMMPDQPNVTPIAGRTLPSEVNTRFVTEAQGEEVNNLYEKDVSANIQTTHYVIRLFTNENVADMTDYIVMPIAGLKRLETGVVQVSDHYIPPLTRVDGSPYIMDQLSNVYGNIKRSLTQLESYKFGEASETASGQDALNYMAPILIKYRLALQVLSRYYMQLRQVIRDPSLHPKALFEIFQCFIGDLTAFTPKVSVLSADVDDHALSMSYDHFDIGPLFKESVRLIRTLLDEIVVSEDLNISMERESDGVFGVVMPEKFFKLNNRFYLVVVTSEDPKNWLKEFTSFGRVASAHRLKELVRRSLPGLKFTHQTDTPPGLPARQNAHYFLMDQGGALWEDIYNSRSLAVNWDGAPANARIDLSVVEG